MDNQHYDYYGQQTPGYSHYPMQMMNQMPQRQGMVDSSPGMSMQHQQMNRYNSMNMQQRMNMAQSAGMSMPPGHMPQYPGTLPHDRVSPSMISGRGDMQIPVNPNVPRPNQRQAYMNAFHQMGADDYDDYNDPNMMYMNGGQYSDGRMMVQRNMSRMGQQYTRAPPVTMSPVNPRTRKLRQMMTKPALHSPRQTFQPTGILPNEVPNGIKSKDSSSDFAQSILNITKSEVPDINLDPSFNTASNYDLKNIISAYSQKKFFTIGIDCNELGKFSITNPTGENHFYSHFVSPWEADVNPSPSFYMLPRCYNDPNNVNHLFKDIDKEFFNYVDQELNDEPESIKNLEDATLIYIFYAFPRDLYQLVASYFLYKRGLLYHKQQQRWYQFSTTVPENSALFQQYSPVQYFDVNEWRFISSPEISRTSPEFMSITEIVSNINLAKSTYSRNQEQ